MLERYNPILKTIRGLLDPTAHIAGGAVRDTLLERPIRDVDLFLDADCTDKAATLLRSQFGFVKVGEWKNYEMFSDPAIKWVARFERADEVIPLCVIGLKTSYDDYDRRRPLGMQDNLSRFDFGICMAAWDGDKVYTAPGFKNDIEQECFTLYRADNRPQFNYSMSRFKKMTADRYAGWKLVVPAKFEKMAKEYARDQTHYYDHDAGEWLPREYVDGPQLLTPKAR